MKKGLLFVLLLVSLVGFGQCPPGSITLSSQAEVDSFAVIYSGCTELQNSLIISGSDIVDLNPLSVITSITDVIRIENNPQLTTLAGLENITTFSILLGATISIINNESLVDILALSNISISFNTSYTNQIEIFNNPALESLDGLQGLSGWATSLAIENNDAITNLTGLTNFTGAGSFTLKNNEVLHNFIGADNFIGMEFFYVLDNPNLVSFEGFNTVYPFCTLEISNNPILENINFLTDEVILYCDEITLIIENNPALVFCSSNYICRAILKATTLLIENNAPGCNTTPEIQAQCSACPNNSLYITEQSEIDNFAMLYPGCTEITNSLSIDGLEITNLNGLNQLVYVDILYIQLTSIPNFSGLENLEIVEREFRIAFNDQLYNFVGLTNLRDIGHFLVDTNFVLNSFNGLQSIEIVGYPQIQDSGLSVQGNYNLSSLNGLQTLTHSRYDVRIAANPNLLSLEGLSGLVNVDNELIIGGSDSLFNLAGLESLESIGGTLSIISNNNLQSLGKLENLDPQTIAGNGFLIQYNPNLSICDIDFICQNLNYPGVQVNDNAPGCNTISQIEYECSIVDFTDPLFRTAILDHNPVIDTDGDGEIQYVEAEDFNGTIEVSNRNISSFGGLEAFINITGLNVSQNSMEFLDLSNNIAIESIVFTNNPQLRSVNLKNGNNTGIQNFQGTNCPNLTYICVDDAVYATSNFLEVDPQVIFTEDCTLSISEFVLTENIKLFPNPVSSTLNIKTSENISFGKAKVYSTLGKLILETSEKQINLETLSAGIYFVEIVTDKGSVTKKIIKK